MTFLTKFLNPLKIDLTTIWSSWWNRSDKKLFQNYIYIPISSFYASNHICVIISLFFSWLSKERAEVLTALYKQKKRMTSPRGVFLHLETSALRETEQKTEQLGLSTNTLTESGAKRTELHHKARYTHHMELTHSLVLLLLSRAERSRTGPISRFQFLYKPLILFQSLQWLCKWLLKLAKSH